MFIHILAIQFRKKKCLMVPIYQHINILHICIISNKPEILTVMNVYTEGLGSVA